MSFCPAFSLCIVPHGALLIQESYKPHHRSFPHRECPERRDGLGARCTACSASPNRAAAADSGGPLPQGGAAVQRPRCCSRSLGESPQKRCVPSAFGYRLHRSNAFIQPRHSLHRADDVLPTSKAAMPASFIFTAATPSKQPHPPSAAQDRKRDG